MIRDDVPPSEEFSTMPEDVGVPVSFRFDDPEWLNVVFVDGDGEVAVTLDYDGSGTQVNSFRVVYPAGGVEGLALPHVITSPVLPEGYVLRVSRATPLVQLLELTANAPLPAKSLERSLDHLTMALQDQRVENGAVFRNVLSFPPREPETFTTQLPAADERRGTLLGFDGESGEMSLMRPEEVSQGLVNEQVTLLRRRANAILTDAKTKLRDIVTAATATYYYRHRMNHGIKLGVVGDVGQVELPENVPGPESITIQSGTTGLEKRAAGLRSVSIGYSSGATGDYGITIGSFSVCDGEGAVSLGHHARAAGMHSVAAGHAASAAQVDSVAIGPRAKVLAPVISGESGCVAVGSDAEAKGTNSVAVGMAASAGGNAAVAVGYLAKTQGDNQTSIGPMAGAGLGSVATERSLSLGYASNGAKDACAAGVMCKATAQYGTAVGVECEATAVGATAVGHKNKVAGVHASAFGYSNTVVASGARSTAIGREVNLSVSDSVDIRSGSPGARVFLSGATGATHLSYRLTDTAPTATNAIWGTEAGTVIPMQMLGFRVSADKTELYIDVSVADSTQPTGYRIKKATLNLA